MKKAAFFAGVVLALFCTNNLNAQNNKVVGTPPSDVPTGYTYDFEKAQRIIISRQVQPDNTNADAQAIIDSKDFPKLGNGSEATKEYLEKLRKWMEINPTVIIQALKSHKEIVQQY